MQVVEKRQTHLFAYRFFIWFTYPIPQYNS